MQRERDECGAKHDESVMHGDHATWDDFFANFLAPARLFRVSGGPTRPQAHLLSPREQVCEDGACSDGECSSDGVVGDARDDEDAADADCADRLQLCNFREEGDLSQGVPSTQN